MSERIEDVVARMFPGVSISPPPKDEAQFKRWYGAMSQEHGLNPDPEGQFYDYRAAFKEGAEPDDTGHWPSQFKLPGHPAMVVGGFHVQTGERVLGTPRASLPELIELGWDPETASRLANTPDFEPTPRAIAQIGAALKRGM